MSDVELSIGVYLTREVLRETFARAYCAEENSHKVLDTEICLAMEKELFGEQVTEREDVEG